MKDVREGTSPYHFIEVMGCPGGCLSGGGQPRPKTEDTRQKRMEAIYKEDENKALRKSQDNPFINELYREFLGTPFPCLIIISIHYTRR